METLLDNIQRGISSYRFDVIDEKELQEQLYELVLKDLGFIREFHLSKESIIDFYHMETKVGIEVKIGGAKMAIYRQCRRYAKTGRLSFLYVVSSKDLGNWFEDIEGVPSGVIKLGENLL